MNTDLIEKQIDRMVESPDATQRSGSGPIYAASREDAAIAHTLNMVGLGGFTPRMVRDLVWAFVTDPAFVKEFNGHVRNVRVDYRDDYPETK